MRSLDDSKIKSPKRLCGVRVWAFLLLAGSWALAAPQTTMSETRPAMPAPAAAAIEALIQQGQWEEAEKQAATMLAAGPAGAEGRRWREEIRVLWATSAVYLNTNPTVEGELWVRRHWVGFRPLTEAAASVKPFQFRVDQIEPDTKKNTDWSLNQWGSYGIVTHLLQLKKADGQKLLFALRKAGAMSRRIDVLRFKSRQPDPPAGPDFEATLAGMDAAAIRAAVPGWIEAGRWPDAEKAVARLLQLDPQDAEALRFRDEIAVIADWPVRTWYTSGHLYLRQHWLTLVGEEYLDGKVLKDDSFHCPLAAIRKASLTWEPEYGATSGTGGLLDLVPGWATDVVTAKWWGFHIDYQLPGGKKTQDRSMYIDGEQASSKQSAREELKKIKSAAGIPE